MYIVCVCVCVPAYLGLQETKRLHQPVVVHLCLLTNELIIYGRQGEEFSAEELSIRMKRLREGLQQCNAGTHEYHSGQCPCAR